MPTTATLINRLTWERHDLAKVRPEDRDESWAQRAQEVQAELLDLRAIPPDGWTLPKPVADLLEHAKAHGWKTAACWSLRPGSGDPMMCFEAARPHGKGFGWQFQVTWVASGAATSMRRLSAGLQRTPTDPDWRPAPSLSAIRAVIAANPAGAAE